VRDDPLFDSRVEQMQADLDDRSSGVNAFMATTLTGVYLPVLVISTTIPKFSQVFSEMLAGEPLPALTTAVCSSPVLIVVVATALWIGGLVAIIGRRQAAVGAAALGALMILGLAIVLGLFLPLVKLTEQIGG
jgi:hypothetical protein